MAKTSVFSALQLYRGIAALLVVGVHSARHVDRVIEGAELERFFAFGDSGVQFFFVLSGFIIHYSCRRLLGKPAALKIYLWKRLTRIYPPYWIILVGLAAAYFAVPDFGEPRHRDVAYFVRSFLLVPQDRTPYLGIAWTLVYEMVFYLLFSVVILRVRAIWVIGAVLLLLSVVRGFLPDDSFWLLRFFCNPNMVLFLLGMLTSVILQRREYQVTLGIRRNCFWAGILVYAGTAFFLHEPEVSVYPGYDLSVTGFGIASTLLVIGSIGMRVKFGTLLGDASYSIYLIHIPAIGLGGSILERLVALDRWPSMALFLTLGVLSVIVGVVFYLLVERRILEFVRARTPA